MNMNIDWESLGLYWGLCGIISMCWINFGLGRQGGTVRAWEDLIVVLMGPLEPLAYFFAWAGRMTGLQADKKRYRQLVRR